MPLHLVCPLILQKYSYLSHLGRLTRASLSNNNAELILGNGLQYRGLEGPYRQALLHCLNHEMPNNISS